MAAFAISYNGLTHGNIRHIYSYKTTPTFIPTPPPHGQNQPVLAQTLVQRFPPRFYDYYPAFSIGLPRAPAFNRLTAGEVREMVARMTKPITCQQQRVRSPRSKEHERSRRDKKVKVVRFRSPAQSPANSSSENSDKHPDRESAERVEEPEANPSLPDEVEVEVKSENERVKDGSNVKVKSDKLSERSDTKRKKQKQSVRQEQKRDKFTLPPIHN